MTGTSYAPTPQPLPPCSNDPRRLCEGDCQYILPVGECLHDWEMERQLELDLKRMPWLGEGLFSA